MSIFEAKEWWSTTISNNEEFDSNSIIIDNIDNENPYKNKICVSSFSGILRIFEPIFGNYRIENLLFEKNYDNPILQIINGNFILNSQDKQIAILQSKRLFVIQLFNLKGSATSKVCYEHKLTRNGYNMCLGRIGERNNDIIFVQSIDGVISIFEQDSLVNSVQMNEVIFPGPFAFLSRKDNIVISNTAYEVECYAYNNLATVTSKSEDKKIVHSWVANIGELVKEIKIINNKITKKQEILILSETLLSLLDDNGKFLFQKKLDYEPMSIHTFNIEDPNYSQNKQINLMYMISTTQDHILVYKGLNLSWAVKIFDTSVFLQTSEFDGMKGLIVSLSDTGRLSVLYLGMEPVKNTRIALPAKNVDLNQISNETENFLNIIENYEKGHVVISPETLQINLEVDPNIYLDDDVHDERIFYQDHSGQIYRSQVAISLQFDGEFCENIRVQIVPPYNVICDEPSFMINKLSKYDQPYRKFVNFRVVSTLFPTFSSVKVYAHYTIKNSQNVTEKTIQSTGLEFDIPLSLFVRTTQITKDAKHKITLCTDKDPINIPKLFEDLTENFIDSSHVTSSPNMIAFTYPNKAEVTIIVSKNAGRYRIQSHHYESLLFITNQILIRLNEHFKYEINFYIEDDVNLDNYFSIVENHFKLNSNLKLKNEELEKYTSLYTIVQKSLLNKYKEKNPPNLNNLDFLLKNIYKSLTNHTDELLKISNEMKVNLRDIIIWTESILYMIKLRSRMSDDHYLILKDSFPLDNLNGNENCWEDITLANMTNLFKFYFSNEKSNLQEVKEIKDLDKWKKYFKTLCDRLMSNKGF